MATMLGVSSCAVVTSVSYPAIQKEAIFYRRSFTAVIKGRSNGRCGSKQQAIRTAAYGVQNAKAPRRHTIVRSQAAEEEPTVDNSTVLVVGGGGLGLETFRALSTAGSWVTVYQRSDKYRKDIEGLGAMLAIGDVLDPKAVAKTVNSNTFDAIVCTVGGGTERDEVDKSGPINLIDAAKKAGVKRFILISSIGAGDSKHCIKEKGMPITEKDGKMGSVRNGDRKVTALGRLTCKIFVKHVSTYKDLEKVLIAKGVAEDYLKASGLDYTIIRPGGLLNDGPPTATGKGILTEDTSISGLISRADVANLILKILFDKRTISKTYSSINIEMPLPPGRRTDGIELLALA